MKTKLILFGSSFQAKVILAEIEEIKRYDIIGYIDNHSYQKKILFNQKIVPKLRIDDLIIYKNTKGVFGIGENYTRFKIYNEVKKIFKSFKWEKIISKNAIVSKKTKIGSGSFIAPGSVINHNTKIGKNCLINTGSIVEHDNNIQDYASLGPGVRTGGNVMIDKFSYIGIGSVIKHQIYIDENVLIGANSFVNKDCSKNKVYFGNPAKFKRIYKKNDSQFGKKDR